MTITFYGGGLIAKLMKVTYYELRSVRPKNYQNYLVYYKILITFAVLNVI